MTGLGASFGSFYQDVVLSAPRVLVGLVEALLIVTAIIVAGRRFQAGLRKGRLARATNQNLAILIGRLTYLSALGVAIIWIAYLFGIQLTGLLTFLGALSLAVTFAIQDVLKNLVAGLYLLWERPFVIGDAIKVKDVSGAVEDIQVRVTLLRAENGQLIVVPNAVLFTEIVINRRFEKAEPEAAAPGS